MAIGRQVESNEPTVAHGGPDGITFEWYSLLRSAPLGSTEQTFVRAPSDFRAVPRAHARTHARTRYRARRVRDASRAGLFDRRGSRWDCRELRRRSSRVCYVGEIARVAATCVRVPFLRVPRVHQPSPVRRRACHRDEESRGWPTIASDDPEGSKVNGL